MRRYSKFSYKGYGIFFFFLVLLNTGFHISFEKQRMHIGLTFRGITVVKSFVYLRKINKQLITHTHTRTRAHTRTHTHTHTHTHTNT